MAILGDLSSVHTPRLCCALKDRGFDVLCFSLEPWEGEPISGVYIKPRLKPKRLRYFSTAPQVFRRIRDFDPDLVIALNVPNYGFLTLLIPKVAPIYLFAWGADLLLTARKSALHRMITSKILKRADRLNVDARIMRRLLIQQYRIPKARIDFMTWGLPEKWFEKPPERVWKPPWRVICHRRLDHDMDPMTVTKGFREALRKGFDGELLMVGRGPFLNQLRMWVKKEGLQKRIRIQGWIKEGALMPLLDSAHIYTTGAFVDSTSVSLLEAMARGLFPVVGDIPGNREWILQGVNGLLFRPHHPEELAHALIDATRNEDRLREAAKKNLSLVKKKARFESHLDRIQEILKGLAMGIHS